MGGHITRRLVYVRRNSLTDFGRLCRVLREALEVQQRHETAQLGSCRLRHTWVTFSLRPLTPLCTGLR